MQYGNHSLESLAFFLNTGYFLKYLKHQTSAVICQTSCPSYWNRSLPVCFLVGFINKIPAVEFSGWEGWWCWLYGCFLTWLIRYYCLLDFKATACSWKHSALFLLRNCSFNIFCHFLSWMFHPSFSTAVYINAYCALQQALVLETSDNEECSSLWSNGVAYLA